MLIFLSLTGTDNPEKQFLKVAMHSGIDTNSSNYMRIKDSLKLNSWHRYNQWFTGDEIDADISFLSPRVQYRVDQNNQRDLSTVFGRRITDYCAWGQRSDYQCEVIPDGNYYWFYSYNISLNYPNGNIFDTIDNSQFGSMQKVKFCRANPSSPGSNAGYIVQGLKANREQSNRYWSPWQSDSLSDWYVKPRIRIPTGLAPTTQVCKIEILNWDSNIVKSVDISAVNFQTQTISYDGNYMDEFYFQSNPNILTPIKIDSFKLCPGPYSQRKEFWNWESVSIKTDFRVYWYGQCDMWIDYIRVENEQARKLYEDVQTETKIRSEVNSALIGYDASRPNNFYLEEFEFNTTPCIKRVREIIEDESQGRLTLITNLNPYMYNFTVPYYENNRFTAEDFEKYLMEDAGVSKVATTFYFLEGFDSSTARSSKNPYTLPVYRAFPSLNYNPGKGILAYKTSPSNYDDWLQDNFDENTEVPFNFTELMKMMDNISKDKEIDFLFLTSVIFLVFTAI